MAHVMKHAKPRRFGPALLICDTSYRRRGEQRDGFAGCEVGGLMASELERRRLVGVERCGAYVWEDGV